MNDLMEITREEYEELVRKIDLLQETLNSTNGSRADLRHMVKELPIEYVRTIDDIGTPIFVYHRYLSGDTWKAFRDLARCLHTTDWEFYASTENIYTTRPYIRSNDAGHKTPSVRQMTQQQKHISTEMLNELIPIYNKYFKNVHQEVSYILKYGEKTMVPVIDKYKGATK